MRVVIIRHSERLDYSNPLLWMVCIGHYWNDSPLTWRGYTMAKERGRKMAESGLKPKNIYTSPYNRTMATANEILRHFPGATLAIEPLLSEYQPSSPHTVSLHPDGIPTTFEGLETEFKFPESETDLEKRVRFIVSKLVEKNNDDIILVTHGEILKVFTNYLVTAYPDLILDLKGAPYLTSLSFEFDKNTQHIDSSTIQVEHHA
jgi:broad specificity phosphatase PhoE